MAATREALDAAVEPAVRAWEPRLALESGEDGLAATRELLRAGEGAFDIVLAEPRDPALRLWIEARIRAHFDAGADHVGIQALRGDGDRGPDLRLLEALAPALQ